MIKYRIDVLAALKAAGYSTYKLRTKKIMSESTIQKFRDGEIVNIDNLSLLCKLLNCQPGDILEYTDDSDLQADNSRKSDSLNQQAAADPAGPLS